MAEDAIKATVNEKPSKKQIINNTLVVIAAILLVGAFIWVIDLGLGWLIKLFLGNA